MAKVKFGYMDCPDCLPTKTRVVVKANERETLSFTCPECDSTAYVKKGAGNYGAWLGKIEKVPQPAADPKPDPKPADPKPVPVGKPGHKTAFGY